MHDVPGPLIASGRAADVHDLGDGTVLRRCRDARDVTDEARLMRWVAERGMPVPAVLGAEGADLVMERIDGPTMLEDLHRSPHRLVAHARCLADLQARLAALEAPDWLTVPSGVPEGASVLHLDLHPANVILSGEGPVVIDWTNAARGTPPFDAAYSFVIMATFEVSGVRDRLGRWILCTAFARRRGRRMVREHLGAACARRLRDVGITPGEAAAVRRLQTARRRGQRGRTSSIR